METNTVFFMSPTEDALKFYRKNGFVCFSSAVPNSVLGRTELAWSDLVERYSGEIGVGQKKYLADISQWRNLWKADKYFLELLSDHLALFASWGLELPGSRLLYDHMIRKNAQDSNGMIPWHQDSMYLPVDRTGCATWLAIDDVCINNGCLEVLSGSHRQAISRPVDFMGERSEFDESCITALPVQAGDLVVIHSKVWHRSQSTSTTATRLAHIGFWVPEQTHYAPDNARWHLLNKQVSVPESSVLNEDEFPVFGQRSVDTGSSTFCKHQGVDQPTGMFNARRRIEQSVQKQMGKTGSLGEILTIPAVRKQLAERASTSEFSFESNLQLIERIWVSAAAFEMHGSRNVFDSAYTAWEARFGTE